MMHTVAGLFESHRTADLVVEHLIQEYGIPRERVRVYGRDASSGAAEARSPQDSDQGASLSDLGLAEEKVRAYAEGIGSGAVLVAAQVEHHRVQRIVAAYQEYGAADIDTNEAEWRGTSSGDAVD
jgi:hypothetical protein